MQTPTVALTTTITLDGEVRTLKYGLLAFKALNLNPFDKATIATFNARRFDLCVVSELMSAGLLHEYYGKAATRRGEVPPSPDDLLADFDLDPFVAACGEIFKLLQSDAAGSDEPGEPNENPPPASTG